LYVIAIARICPNRTYYSKYSILLKKAVFLPLHCILEAEGRSSDRPTHADGSAALAVGPP
jgi:hypothetical protein